MADEKTGEEHAGAVGWLGSPELREAATFNTNGTHLGAAKEAKAQEQAATGNRSTGVDQRIEAVSHSPSEKFRSAHAGR